MKFKFTRVSSNAKTGPIPVTMTERASCPDACPLRKNGCYADNFPLSLHWNRVADTGISLEQLCEEIAALPDGQLWRHNVAGDLPMEAYGLIDRMTLHTLTWANGGKRGFTYTHHELNHLNVGRIREANTLGFTVNVSTNSSKEAVNVVQRHKLPTVCLLPKDETRKSFDVDGVKVVTCPATLHDDVTCASCGMCANAAREFVIGFPAHGARAKKVEVIFKAGA